MQANHLWTLIYFAFLVWVAILAIGGTADGWLRMQLNYDLAQLRARGGSIKLKRLEPKVA